MSQFKATILPTSNYDELYIGHISQKIHVGLTPGLDRKFSGFA